MSEINVHKTVAGARFHEATEKSETFGVAADLCGGVRTIDAARTLVDLAPRSSFAGL